MLILASLEAATSRFSEGNLLGQGGKLLGNCAPGQQRVLLPPWTGSTRGRGGRVDRVVGQTRK